MNTCPDQRASLSTKATKEWYRQMADFVIGLATSSSDRAKTQAYLNAANGVLSPEDYAYVMKTYITAEDSTEVENALNSDALGRLRDVDILTPIKEKYMGEFINSYHNYQVYSLDPTVVLKRNAELSAKVEKLMFEKLNALLAQAQGNVDPNTGKPVAPDIDIKSFITEFLENWVDQTVIDEQNALELLNTVIEAKRKYIDAYFYWFACEEVYTYRRLSGNDVLFEVVNPMEYYRVDSGNYFVEDDSFGLRRQTLTLQEVIDTYYNNMEDGLTEEQMKLLKDMANSQQAEIGYLSPAIFLDYKRQFPDDFKVTDPLPFTKQGLITVVDHYFFKTEVKKGILTYVSPTGEVAEMDVDETYKLNKKDGDLDIEWLWINQMWEGWRFGDEACPLYIPPRPVDLQRELLSNSSVCKAPYNGASYIHKSNVKKPIPYRIKDNLALYKIYTLLEERWIAKFKSWLMVPESILADSKDMKTEDRLQQADIDSLFPFNDADLASNPNAINYFKEVATTAVIKYIEILNQVKQSIKAEAWELANMNSSRFGSDNQYKGKAVSEYDYNQATKGTVWSLEMFDAFRCRDYMANLDHSRVAWINGKQGSFVDENTKELKVIGIDGESHLGANIGIFISNSSELDQQAKALQQIAFSMGQNDQQDVAAEAVTNKNISKLKQYIKTATKAKQEFQLKLSTAAEEAKQRTAQMTMQNDQAQRDHEMEIVDKQLGSDFEIAVLENDTKIEMNRAKLEVDTNGNGYVDDNEAGGNNGIDLEAKFRAEMFLKNRQQVLKEITASHKMKMDEKKLAKQSTKS